MPGTGLPTRLRGVRGGGKDIRWLGPGNLQVVPRFRENLGTRARSPGGEAAGRFGEDRDEMGDAPNLVPALRWARLAKIQGLSSLQPVQWSGPW